jgi:hypothetical protein
MPSVAFSKAVKRMALPEPFLIRQKARAMDNPDGVSHTKLEAKLTDPERLIIAHALSAAAKPYENDDSLHIHLAVLHYRVSLRYVTQPRAV